MTTAVPDVAIVIVSWNTRDLVLDCIGSLADGLGELHATIYLVDNASADGTVSAVRTRYPDVQVIENTTNVGFAAANNQAIRASDARYVFLLNSDTSVEPGAIEQLVRFADARAHLGAVGPMLLNRDGTFQGSYADLPSLIGESLTVTGLGRRLLNPHYPNHDARHAATARRVGYIQGAAMLIRRDACRIVGLLDEGYFMYSEEVDLCWRLWLAGWEVWYTPDARVLHYGGQSTRQMRTEMLKALYRSKVRFFRKYHGSAPAALLRVVVVVTAWTQWLLRYRRRAGQRPPAPLGWRDLHST